MFLRYHTRTCNFAWQKRCSSSYSILYVYRSNIRIYPLFKENLNIGRTIISCGRSNVTHSFYSINLFFQRNYYTFHHRFCIRTCIIGRNRNCRWCNIRILSNWQCYQSQNPEYHYNYRNYRR